MLNLKNLTLRRGAKLLLDGADLTLFPGQKAGLVGANGSGKSSLMALLRGELHPDGGDADLPPQWVIAHVAQETPALDMPALDYVLQGDAELVALEAELAGLDPERDGGHIGELHARLAAIDGYAARSRAARLLSGLGFAPGSELQAVASFSGGWRMRLNLAQALMCRSDCLLLDEPTNHLDLETVVWLEHWLKHYPGMVLLISHDRDFLDNTVEQIVHLAEQQLTLYAGGYSDFERQRAERLMQQQAAFVRQQRERAHLQSFIDRFRAKATKARQAQSRIKALERMEAVAAVRAESPFEFDFREPVASPNPLLKLDGCALGYPGKASLERVTLTLEAGARIGLLGVNGAGKSTLIKAFAGKLSPLAGARDEARGLAIGYFAQHQLEALDPAASPLLHLQRLDPAAREQELRDFLGGFDFRGDMASAAVAPFSGGEKARLALAMLIWQRPNLLLLDEPTNHLDLEMREALTLALQGFSGALVLVSHDRHLLRATTDTFWLVEGGRVQPFDGDLDDYARYRLETDAALKPSAATAIDSVDRKTERRLAAEARQELAHKLKPLKQQLAKLETQVEHLSRRKAELDGWMASEAAYAAENRAQLAAAVKEAGELASQLEGVELQWLETQEQIESLQAS